MALIFCADLETTKSGQVSLAAFMPCVLDFKNQTYTVLENDYHVFIDLKAFFFALSNYARLKDAKNVYCYFHNLGNFDGTYILHYLFTTKAFSQKCGKNKLLYNNQFEYTTLDNNSIYRIAVNYNGVIINFLDSFKHLSLSIATLGEKQGFKKLESKYEFEVYQSIDQVPVVELEYLKRDVLIMTQPLCTYLLNFEKQRLTAGANALEELSRKIDKQKFNYFTQTSKELAIDFTRWVRGGLTFYNQSKLRTLLTKIYCYDANSFYPTIMTRPLIIAGTIQELGDNESLPNASDIVVWHEYVIKKIKPKFGNDYHFFYSKKQAKYINEFDIKNNLPEFVYYFENEFNELLNWYDIDYDIAKTYYAKTAAWAAAWINELYKIRKDLVQQNDPRQLTYKIMLNSIYGKLCEKPEKYYLRYIPVGALDPNVDWIQFYKDWTCIKKKNKRFDMPNYEAWITKEKLKEEIRNPIVGAHITAQARTELMRLVRMNYGHVVYGDTDSIYVDKILHDFENDTGNLGGWKREYPQETNGFGMYIYGRKRYVLLNEATLKIVSLRMCGSNKKTIEAVLQEALKEYHIAGLRKIENVQIPNAKLLRSIIDGKAVLVPTTYKIKVANNETKIQPKKVRKKIKQTRFKRVKLI